MTYYLIDILTLGCINAMIVIGLNLQYGYAGILNLTYYTFVAIGAYTAAITTIGPHPAGYGHETYILGWSLPWPVALILAGLAASLFGLLILTAAIRRLRSDYFGIVTVSIGYIVWEVITNETKLVNGASGLYGIPQIAGTASLSAIQYTLVILALSSFALGVVFITARFIFHSPYGRLLRAVREDELVAESFGKDVLKARISIFLVGCFIAGVAGALLVFYLTAWSPAAFLPIETFYFLAALIIGGTGSYKGALVGAFLVLEFLTEVTRFLPTFGHPEDVGAVRAILIGTILILVLRFMPAGLIRERPASFYRAHSQVGGRSGILPRGSD